MQTAKSYLVEALDHLSPRTDRPWSDFSVSQMSEILVSIAYTHTQDVSRYLVAVSLASDISQRH